MSKETTPLGDDERDNEASHEDDESFDSMMDAIEVEGDDSVRMTLREMQEAINDESHPQHEEALRQNKKLADALNPAMQALNERVAEQISRIKVPVSFDPKMVIQNESFKKIVESTPSITDIIPKVYTDDASVFPKSAIVQPAIESQYRRNFEETLDNVADAVQERDERAERQLDVLQTMVANLQQLNQKMESVDRRIDESNKSAGKASRWALIVGISTLIVTIIGVIVTMIMG